MTWIRVISCILYTLFDDTVPILRTFYEHWAVRGVCDIRLDWEKNADSAISNSKQLTFRIDSFERLVTLLGRLIKQ